METRIATELGASQAPVREAPRDLELLRMVGRSRSAEPGGAFGDASSSRYPVRAALEGAAETTKRVAGDVSVLEQELQAMRAAAKGDLVARPP